ncbi:uncharacterized protein [Nicotiana sylvestris]|uniref:uncharacterized protein n=1 Tax=Nicotiana sylvestris TaxID=4096 RepID=UPI00388CD7DF
MMKNLSINVPLVEALEQMTGYAKFMKDLMINKRSMNYETIKKTHQVSAFVHSMAPKLEDPGAFTSPCTIGSSEFAKALCDLGASKSLMPYSVFMTMGIGQPRSTSMRLQMANRTMKRPLGVIKYVLVRVDNFILPVDFVILDCEIDYEVPIILCRPFFATGKALNDVEVGELTFRVGDEKVVFHMCKSMRKPNSNETPLWRCYEEEESYWTDTGGYLGISPTFCVHKINLEEGAKPSIDHQRRLNEAMQKVVKKEIIKWLDDGVVYPISDSSWTSPVQCVLKKRGMTVVINDNNELIPTRTLPPNSYFSGGLREIYFYMSLWYLCFQVDAIWVVQYTGDFQRCMMAIFTDTVEDYLEVFMDNFSVVGNSFDDFLANLDKLLARCEETNLVLN